MQPDDFDDLELDASAPSAPDDGRELFEHFRFVADKGQQLLRVDKFLVTRIEKSSRNRIQQAAEAGCILVNGRTVKSNYRVKPLDVVTVVMDRPRYELEIIPENITINIVYEDEAVLVVDKPAGMVVHPGHGNYSGTLVNALAWHFKDNPDYDADDPRMGLVHRIDKDTSGLLVVAKTPDAKTALGRQFFEKTTKREYVAVVWGCPDPQVGTIVGNIGRSLSDRLRMDVFPEGSEYGRHAVTHYETLEKLGPVSVVKCVLETGRTHQIRGDQILRGERTASYRKFVDNCAALCSRQALHARTLGFVHPVTRKEMFFTSPVPDDMRQMIEKWRGRDAQMNKNL